MAVGRVVGGIGRARDLHLREKYGEDCGWASPRFLAPRRTLHRQVFHFQRGASE